MFMPEMYDNIYYRDSKLVNEYYSQNRVYKLGEYAIHSLSNHYKYTILPHLIARNCQPAIRYTALDILRKLRLSLFFNNEDFLNLYNEFCSIINVLETYIIFY